MSQRNALLKGKKIKLHRKFKINPTLLQKFFLKEKWIIADSKLQHIRLFWSTWGEIGRKWSKRKKKERFSKIVTNVLKLQSMWVGGMPRGKKVIIFSVPKNFGINLEFAPSPSKTINLLSGIHIQLRSHTPLKNTEAWSRRSRPKISKCVGFYPPRPANLCCQCIGTGNTILCSCGRLTYSFTSVCKYTDTQHVKCILITSAVVHFHTIKHN
jgi:hypothetical protein